MPSDPFCWHNLRCCRFCIFGGHNSFAYGKVHLMKHLMTLLPKLQELHFHFGAQISAQTFPVLAIYHPGGVAGTGPVSTCWRLRFIVDTSAAVGGGVWPSRNLMGGKRAFQGTCFGTGRQSKMVLAGVTGERNSQSAWELVSHA